MACSGSESTKNSTPLLFWEKVIIVITTKVMTAPTVISGMIGLPAMNLIKIPKGVRLWPALIRVRRAHVILTDPSAIEARKAAPKNNTVPGKEAKAGGRGLVPPNR